MKEPELYSPPAENFIQRGEDRVPHPGLHAPVNRSVIREQNAQNALEIGSGGDGRPGTEEQIVETTHQRGRRHIFGGAVVCQPLRVVILLDGFKPVQQNTVSKNAANVHKYKLGQDPEAPQFFIFVTGVHLPVRRKSKSEKPLTVCLHEIEQMRM